MQPLKAAQIILCRLMGIATIVLTTGISGREDLFKKFTTFVSGGINLSKSPDQGGHSGAIPRMRGLTSSINPGFTAQKRFRYERVEKMVKVADRNTCIVAHKVPAAA